jgi:hypothetical protein
MDIEGIQIGEYGGTFAIFLYKDAIEPYETFSRNITYSFVLQRCREIRDMYTQFGI